MPIRRLRLTVLVENTAGGRGVLAEHGLAVWVEADDTNILFDTGQGLALTANAEALGIDLSRADAVVLSHGHYDHTGGLEGILKVIGGASVYVHPKAFDAKYGQWPVGASSYIGSPIRSIDRIGACVSEVIPTIGPTRVAEGVYVTGEIPRRHDIEDTGGPFYLDEACVRPDPLVDDQALYLESVRGIVVLLGCGHSGLANTLDYIAELSGVDRFHAVLGGMHLVAASDERIALSQRMLQRYEVQCVGPAHCTGRLATTRLWESFPDKCVGFTTGTRFVFE